MPIFNLYLSTQVTSSTTSGYNPVIPINKTSLNNVTWNIDWSNLFKGEEKNYKYCRVRFNMVSNSFTSVANAWNNLSGYLTCNLSSQYGLTGTGAILGLTYPIDCPTTGSTTHVILVNTLSECGVDVIIPGPNNSNFTLTYMNDDAQTINATFSFDYEILLTFELYN